MMSLCTRVSHYWTRGPLRPWVTGHMCCVGACEAVGVAEAGEEAAGEQRLLEGIVHRTLYM